MLQFASLGSGSRGNATLVRTAGCTTMLDCGFSASQAEKRLQRLDVEPESVDALLVTHEHSDHAAGALAFSRKFSVPVYTTFGTASKLQERARKAKKPHAHPPELLRTICSQAAFTIADMNIQANVVPHDAREPVQFTFSTIGDEAGEALMLGVLTDLGKITSHVLDCYRACNALVLESNHDSDMLWRGSYPRTLKERVAGDYGHLSNAQAAGLLRELDLPRLQHLVVAHVSEQNNSLACVQDMLEEFESELANIIVADQQEGFGWLNVA